MRCRKLIKTQPRLPHESEEEGFAMGLRNSAKKNHEDLRGFRAIEKIRDLAEKTQACFFCTTRSGANSSGARPMNICDVDEAGDVWFVSSNDSNKNAEIMRDHSVRLYFQSSCYSNFLFLEGNAAIVVDKTRVKELWEPVFRKWFSEGIEDPRITLIRFTPREGYYWDTQHGIVAARIKMFLGNLVGKKLDDSVEGTLSF